MLSPTPCPLTCVGKDGIERTFWYTVEQDAIRGAEVVHVRVHPRNPPYEADDHWFDLVLTELGTRQYRISELERNRTEYGGRGIPDALIPELTRRFGIEVWSSLKSTEDNSERRSPEADKMWERLRLSGLASYCKERGRYRCPR